MHIAEGAISGTPAGLAVLAGGGLLTAAGTAISLRRMSEEEIPRVALLSAAFFVASFIHIPLGFTSIHLVLNGLVGLVLGWDAFPAILVALWFQALLFGHGGLTTLGVNTFCMAAPAVVSYYLCRPLVKRGQTASAVAGLLSGIIGILGGSSLVAGALILSSHFFVPAATVFVIAGVGWAVLEGLVCMGAAVGIYRLRPELLGVIHTAHSEAPAHVIQKEGDLVLAESMASLPE